MSETAVEFKEWALVELMGRQRVIGYCTQQVIAGSAMLRVDIPGPDGETTHTRFYGGSSIYAISPIKKETAVAMANQTDSAPIKSWELPPALPASSEPEPPPYRSGDDDF